MINKRTAVFPRIVVDETYAGSHFVVLAQRGNAAK
jgi:hypothetical protein